MFALDIVMSCMQLVLGWWRVGRCEREAARLEYYRRQRATKAEDI